MSNIKINLNNKYNNNQDILGNYNFQNRQMSICPKVKESFDSYEQDEKEIENSEDLINDRKLNDLLSKELMNQIKLKSPISKTKKVIEKMKEKKNKKEYKNILDKCFDKKEEDNLTSSFEEENNFQLIKKNTNKINNNIFLNVKGNLEKNIQSIKNIDNLNKTFCYVINNNEKNNENILNNRNQSFSFFISPFKHSKEISDISNMKYLDLNNSNINLKKNNKNNNKRKNNYENDINLDNLSIDDESQKSDSLNLSFNTNEYFDAYNKAIQKEKENNQNNIINNNKNNEINNKLDLNNKFINNSNPFISNNYANNINQNDSNLLNNTYNKNQSNLNNNYGRVNQILNINNNIYNNYLYNNIIINDNDFTKIKNDELIDIRNNNNNFNNNKTEYNMKYNNNNKNYINEYNININPYQNINQDNNYQYYNYNTSLNNVKENYGIIQLEPKDYLIKRFGRIGWVCSKCNNFNFETRYKCNRCFCYKMPKTINEINLKKEEERKKRIKVKETKPDWICFNCNNLNYGFRKFCNICQIKRTDEYQLINLMDNKLLNSGNNEGYNINLYKFQNNNSKINEYKREYENKNFNINNNFNNNYYNYNYNNMNIIPNYNIDNQINNKKYNIFPYTFNNKN